VFDGDQPEEPLRRPRGRHAVPKAATPGWRARITAAAAPFVASLEPRVSSVGAWLFERRLHVLIVTASAATIAMLVGAVALISFARGPQPADEAATQVSTTRPTSTDQATPRTYAPILPSPGATPTITPTPTPTPGDGSEDPAITTPTEQATTPAPTEEDPRDTAPGATNRPVKPKG
jgi:hypothetical protein